MPIYEYVCEQCQHRFEVKQRVSDPPLSGCVRCGHAVRRVISAPAIMFKGTGWYVTDYSDKLKPPTGAEPAAAPANGKPDQKPAPDQKPSKEATTASSGDGATSSSSDSSGSPASAGSTSGSTAPPKTTTPSSKS